MDLLTPPATNQPVASSSGSAVAQGKQKRMEPDPDLDPAAAEQSTPPKKKRARTKKPAPPKKPSDWHLTKDDIPKNVRSTKELPTQDDAPPAITEADKEPFEQCFRTASHIRSSVQASMDEHSGAVHDAPAWLAKIMRSLPDGSTNASNIERIPEGYRLIILRAVAVLGLSRWAPDVLSKDPESKYNILHEDLALRTFQRVAAGQGYSHMGINLGIVHNEQLIYMFSYMYACAKAEAKSPGAAVRANRLSTVFKRRQDLSIGRVNILKAQCLSQHVISLAKETEAHSDDELIEANDANGIAGNYHIKVKEGRSQKVKTLFRLADVTRCHLASGKRGYRKQERNRVDSPMPQPSERTAIPQAVPIDWFDPEYFNHTLTLREQAQLVKHGVRVALPTADLCATWEQCSVWKNLSDSDFMLQYGNTVLADYNLPTEEDLKRLEEFENDAKEDEVQDDLESNASQAGDVSED
ncbi:hypothetical protein DXG01_003672 [Tephrocybe rancida]|nr:hypothetical protein DXG01_003672 [Tephrocybe rancida]